MKIIISENVLNKIVIEVSEQDVKDSESFSLKNAGIAVFKSNIPLYRGMVADELYSILIEKKTNRIW